MIFSISEFLEFSDDEILRAFEEEGIEITAVREPTGPFRLAMPSR
jgi:hypothetical protein